MAPIKDEAPISTFLRRACIGTWPFAFSLAIAHAASSNSAFPATTLVPQTFSTLFSLAIIYFSAKRRDHSNGSLGTTSVVSLTKEDSKRRLEKFWVFLGDLLALTGLLTCLVFTWLTLGSNSYSWYGASASETMLGTYATVPFMVNMTIHLFFVLQTIYSLIPTSFLALFSPSASSTSVCPNCQHNIGAGQPSTRWAGDRKSGGYSFLHNEESDSLYRDIERQTAGPSEDIMARPKGSEETAREISEVEVAKIIDA